MDKEEKRLRMKAINRYLSEEEPFSRYEELRRSKSLFFQIAQSISTRRFLLVTSINIKANQPIGIVNFVPIELENILSSLFNINQGFQISVLSRNHQEVIGGRRGVHLELPLLFSKEII